MDAEPGCRSRQPIYRHVIVVLRTFVLGVGHLLLGAAVLAGSRCLAAEISDTQPRNVQVELPKMAPKQAMDRDVHPALFVSPDIVQHNPFLSEYLYANSPGQAERRGSFFTSEEELSRGMEALRAKEGYALFTHVNVDLATPVAQRIRELLGALFPATVGSRGAQPGPAIDVLFVADMTSRFTIVQQPPSKPNLLTTILRPSPLLTQTIPLELTVQLKLTAVDRAGTTIASFESSGAAAWRRFHSYEDLGAHSTIQAFDDLERQLRASPVLAAYLHQLAEARAVPAELQATADFDDREGLLPNGRLDAGETGKLVIRVTNRGPGTAYGVAVRAAATLPQVSVSGSGALGDLAAGEQRQVVLSISAALDLPAGSFGVQIDAADKRGYGGRPVRLELTAAPLVPPRLEIVDVALNNGSGRAHGAGDGQPANGETIEAIVHVRNAGPGEAAGVAVSMTSPTTGVILSEPTTVVPHIAGNAVGDARLLLELPVSFAAPALSLAFQAVDVRGARVAQASRTASWPVRARRPAIGVAYHLFDGDSPVSRGNRDHQANNGERLELALVAKNGGEIGARALRLEIDGGDPALVPKPAVLEIGDLPAHAEAMEKRLVLELPRAFGRERPPGDLHLVVRISQQDFPISTLALAVPFHYQSPELALEVASPEGITRGVTAELSVQARNRGELAAEAVVLEIRSSTRGLDLLDERGRPAAAHSFELGVLPAEAGSRRLRVGLLARDTAPAGPATLEVSLKQKDFPPVLQTVRLALGDAPPTVISALRPQPAETASPPITMNAAPATISFLRYSTGEHLLAPSVDLKFEVQAAEEPRTVRLTRNQRQLPLDKAQRTVAVAGGMKIYRYDLLVELDPGSNDLEVVTLSNEGLRNSRVLSLVRDLQQGKLWVVAIGVSTYGDPGIPGLGFAAADARAVHDYFRDALHLPPGQLFLRTDRQATVQAIRSLLGTQLRTLANNPDDTIVIYFAGHGGRERVATTVNADGLEKYLLPYDAAPNDLFGTALRTDELSDILQRLRPERIVVLLDSCFSGAAGGRTHVAQRSIGERAAPLTSEFLDRMVQAGHGRVLLTASGPNEPALEDPKLRHGVFTYYLLEGLRGAAANPDGDIEVDALYHYLAERVPTATDRRQHPERKAPDTAGQILIGKAAASARPGE
jgi:hypothetical protein